MTKIKSVLCIDDDPVVLSVLKARLQKVDGFTVYTAASGKKGIALALKHKVDAILLDWQLPDMSGLQVLETLKGDSRTTWISIHMLTGRTKMGDVERALAKGANGYFTKPLKLNDISKRLGRGKEET